MYCINKHFNIQKSYSGISHTIPPILHPFKCIYIQVTMERDKNMKEGYGLQNNAKLEAKNTFEASFLPD